MEKLQFESEKYHIINGYWFPNKTIVEVMDKDTIIKSCALPWAKSRGGVNTKRRYNMSTSELIENLKQNGKLIPVQEHHC